MRSSALSGRPDLRRTPLEERKRLLQALIKKEQIDPKSPLIHFSDDYPEKGIDLFQPPGSAGSKALSPKNAVVSMWRSAQ